MGKGSQEVGKGSQEVGKGSQEVGKGLLKTPTKIVHWWVKG